MRGAAARRSPKTLSLLRSGLLYDRYHEEVKASPGEPMTLPSEWMRMDLRLSQRQLRIEVDVLRRGPLLPLPFPRLSRMTPDTFPCGGPRRRG